MVFVNTRKEKDMQKALQAIKATDAIIPKPVNDANVMAMRANHMELLYNKNTNVESKNKETVAKSKNKGSKNTDNKQ